MIGPQHAPNEEGRERPRAEQLNPGEIVVLRSEDYRWSRRASRVER
jgi:hypothetical protein